MRYELVPSTRKHLKISVEDVPYMKKKRIKKQSYEEIEYEKAVQAKRAIMTNKSITANNVRIKRTTEIFEDDNFQIIKEAGKNIRKREVLYYAYFALVLVSYALAVGLLAYALGLPILYLTIIPIFFVCHGIIKPKVRFKDLFLKIYLPVCYFCANVKNEDDTLSFDISDKKANWDRKTANNKIVTNTFKIKMKDYVTNIEKMIVRNYITTYRMVNGKLEIGKKLATIFSGYSFEMKYSPLTEEYPQNDILLAIVNDKTFVGTNGLYLEDASTLCLKPFNIRSLESEWQMYIKEGLEIDKKTAKEIEKKIIMISNEIGPFNAYITPGGVRMMINIHTDRSGLKEDFLHAQLKNPEALNYDGFYSVIKTLCVTGYMNKLVKIFFGVKDRQIRVKDENPELIKKKAPKVLTEDDLLNIKNNKSLVENSKREDIGISSKPKRLFHKKGDTSIDTCIGLVLTVVLSGLILLGFISLLNKNVTPSTINNINNVYSQSERSETVLENDLI